MLTFNHEIMKINHLILLLPILAAACSDNNKTETATIRTGEWTLVRQVGYERYDGQTEEWDEVVSNKEWLTFNENSTYTLKGDEEGNGTISYETTYQYTIDGNRLITYYYEDEAEEEQIQTILKHTNSELMLEKSNKQLEYNYEYKSTKTYRYVE